MILFRLLLLICIAATGVGMWAAPDRRAAAADQPNIVWILSEDNSVHYLNLYGEKLGKAPSIGRLAREGIVYEHAFSCSPVCSVARTTLMSGMLAPRVGFQFHRKQQLANLPGDAKLFPAYLRAAGYYTTNRSKKDYNVVEGKVWDESSRKATWRNRPTADTPFFHMQSIGVSHESSLHFKQSEIDAQNVDTDPNSVELTPYQPDTETFRFTKARYFDQILAMDKQVGNIIRQLEEDGLLDETIIFYFGDHGGVLPRSKGYLFETGLHVPLVVRVPESWQARLGVEPGSRMNGFVNFTDFGPTVLNLAGIAPPSSMDGSAFLGPGVDINEVESRDEAFGYADRFDEKYDFCRSLRKGKWKYVRNYEAYLPDGLNNNYRYIQLAYAEWRELYRAGELDPGQRQFFEAKPVEALYDLEQDPHEVNNLAKDPAHRKKLVEMRRGLQDRLLSLPDLSFFPESFLIDEALDDGVTFGRQHGKEIEELMRTIDLSLRPFDEAKRPLSEALAGDDEWQRYWACVAASCFGEEASELSGAIKGLLDDDNLLVRLRAAEFLTITEDFDPRPTLYEILETSDSPAEVLIVLNTVVYLRDHATDYEFSLDGLNIKSINGEVERRLTYLKGPSPLKSDRE